MTKEEIKGIGLVVWQLTSRECCTDEADSQAFVQLLMVYGVFKSIFSSGLLQDSKRGGLTALTEFISLSQHSLYSLYLNKNKMTLLEARNWYMWNIYFFLFFFLGKVTNPVWFYLFSCCYACLPFQLLNLRRCCRLQGLDLFSATLRYSGVHLFY